MELKRLLKKYKASHGRERVAAAWELIREAARYSRHEPYWEFLRMEFSVKPEEIKDAMKFLEEEGELEVHRSVDGRHLWVSTLKDIRENPVRLDRWLISTSKRQPTR
ncbi:hypothetical protein [Thermococcus sp.]